MIFISIFFAISALIIFGGLSILFYTSSTENMTWILSEAGPIETGTAILFFITSIVAFYAFTKNKIKLSFSFSALMAIAAMRELDWHKKWTSDSILKSRFYLSEETPIIEKIFGLVFIITLIATAFIVLKNVPKWFVGLKQNDTTSWGIFCAFGGIITAKLIDSSNRVIPFLLTKDGDNRLQFLALEEGLEFIAAGFFLMTSILLLRRGA